MPFNLCSRLGIQVCMLSLNLTLAFHMLVVLCLHTSKTESSSLECYLCCERTEVAQPTQTSSTKIVLTST